MTNFHHKNKTYKVCICNINNSRTHLVHITLLEVNFLRKKYDLCSRNHCFYTASYAEQGMYESGSIEQSCPEANEQLVKSSEELQPMLLHIPTRLN